MTQPPEVPSPAPQYHAERAWIDTSGKTRTWALLNPRGTKLAEITTKSGALRIARMLNERESRER